MKVGTLLLLVIAFSLSILAFQKDSRTTKATNSNRDRELFAEGFKALKAGDHGDQRLFLAGALAISEGHFDQGRILLNTLINTYSETPLTSQARMLIFYSYAREDGPKNEKAAILLKQIEEQMKAYEPTKQLQ